MIKHNLLIAAIVAGTILMLIVSAIETLLANIPTRFTVTADDSPRGCKSLRGGISSGAQNAKGAAELMNIQIHESEKDTRQATGEGAAHPEPIARITDTLDAARLTIIRHALGQLDCPSIGTDEAAHRVRRAERIAQCARYGVPVALLASPDLERWARRLGVAL